MPDTRITSNPPPDEPVCVAVKIVDDAAAINLFRTHIVNTPVVENPVRSTSIWVYVPDELLSETEIVPPANPDVPAITMIKSPTDGVAVTVLSPAVVFHNDPALVTAAIRPSDTQSCTPDPQSPQPQNTPPDAHQSRLSPTAASVQTSRPTAHPPSRTPDNAGIANATAVLSTAKPVLA
jgi:hypothetical protein